MTTDSEKNDMIESIREALIKGENSGEPTSLNQEEFDREKKFRAFPEISPEQWEQIRQSFIENGIQTKKRALERKLAVGYFSEVYYPVPDEVSRNSYFMTSQIQQECETSAALKINEFWDAMFEIYELDRMSDEGKWLTNSTLMTVNAERGKNCGGMSPETFWAIYINFQDIVARMTKTGDYDPEVIANNESSGDEEDW